MRTVLAGLAWSLACCTAGTTLAWAQGAEPQAPASPERGRALLAQRQETGCILCHLIPGLPTGGALGPSLQDLALRSTPAQVRERIADARRLNPHTLMPPYLSTEGLHNVAQRYRGQTLLTPAAVDDIVSYLFQPAPSAP